MSTDPNSIFADANSGSLAVPSVATAGNPVADGIAAVEQTAADIGAAIAAPTIAGKAEAAATALADTADEAFGLLSELHIINGKLSERGSSIAQLIGAFAKAFAGIHL